MKKWFEIRNAVTGTEIYIYDEIGVWGYRAGDFAKELALLTGDLTIHLNSPGGDVFDGIAIYNLLKNYAGKVTIVIDGMAASIASIIALAGDTIKMASNGIFMIHNPWMFVAGDSEELKKTAEMLDSVKKILVDIYVKTSGLEESEIVAMMDKETWMNAQTAKDKGFIHEVFESQKIAAKAFKDYKFQNQAFLENVLNTQTTEGEKMEEILKALGVTTEQEVMPKILAMQAENAGLRDNVKAFQAKINEQMVESDILNKKLYPSQREYAKNLLNTDKTLYDGFIANNKVVDLTHSIELKDTDSATVTYAKLMETPEKLEELKKSNPGLYNKLFEDFMKEGK